MYLMTNEKMMHVFIFRRFTNTGYHKRFFTMFKWAFDEGLLSHPLLTRFYFPYAQMFISNMIDKNLTIVDY